MKPVLIWGTQTVAEIEAIWQLGWKPGWGVEETFRRTVEWYRAYLDASVPMQKIGLEQIAAYESTLAPDPLAEQGRPQRDRAGATCEARQQR